MKTKLFILFTLFVFVMSACAVAQPAESVPQPTQTPYVLVVTTTPAIATESATPTTAPTFTATLVPTLVPTLGTGCDVLAITNLPARADSLVNNTVVTLQVRDTNGCGRPLWYNETGVAKGANFTFDVKADWVVVTASVTAAIHPEGGSQTDYLDTPVLVVCGPFKGGIGLYEGGVRVYPKEWVDYALANEVMPIQRQQTGKPTLEPIYIGCGQ